jgi:guanylate cyclase activator 1
VAALHLVLRGKLEDKLRWSFKVFDGDENGRLDRAELKKIIRVIYKIKQNGVQDETGTETLTPDEVTDRIFQKIDIDGDGQITLEEFMQGAKNDPWVLNFLRMDINPNAYVMSHMSDKKLEGAKR